MLSKCNEIVYCGILKKLFKNKYDRHEILYKNKK